MKKIIALFCVLSVMLSVSLSLAGCGNSLGLSDEELEFYGELIDIEKRVEGEDIDDLKADVVAYFKEKYSIDVTEELAEMKTFLYRPEYDSAENGKHWFGQPEIFVSKYLYETEMFADTWFHETIHFLGFHNARNEYSELDDTFCEIITLDITEWAGEEENFDCKYIPAAWMCAPMVEANPELVTQIIEEGGSYLIDNINEVLADTTFTSFEVTEEWTVADQLDAYLEVIFQGDSLDYEHDPAVVAGIEEIVNAYCAKFN